MHINIKNKWTFRFGFSAASRYNHRFGRFGYVSKIINKMIILELRQAPFLLGKLPFCLLVDLFSILLVIKL